MKETERECITMPFDPSNAQSVLDYVMTVVPTLSDIQSTYPELMHLGLSEKEISSVLTGQPAYVFGEVTVPGHPRLKVNCGYGRVSVMRVNPNTEMKVCIEGLPIEQYVRVRIQEQKRNEDYLNSHSKEDMLAEIRRLEAEIAHLGDMAKMAEGRNTIMEKTIASMRKLQDLTGKA